MKKLVYYILVGFSFNSLLFTATQAESIQPNYNIDNIDIAEDIRDINGQLEEFDHRITQLESICNIKAEPISNTSKQVANNISVNNTDSELNDSIQEFNCKLDELYTRTTKLEEARNIKINNSNVHHAVATDTNQTTTNSANLVTGTNAIDKVINLKNRIKTLKDRIITLEDNCNVQNIEADQVTPEDKLAASNEIKNLSEPVVIDKARYYIDIKQYQHARNILDAFLSKNPKSIYCGMMHFYIAKSYFVEEQYLKASKEYMTCYSINPTGSKAPKALFKLHLCFMYLGKTDNMNLTLEKIATEFSKTDLGQSAKFRLETLKNQNNTIIPTQIDPK